MIIARSYTKKKELDIENKKGVEIMLSRRNKIFLVIVILVGIFSTCAYAQENAGATTKLEEFISKKGDLIVKEFYELGSVSAMYGSRLDFKAITAYAPGNENNKLKGLKVEITEIGKTTRNKAILLDMDEMESTIQAIDYMTALAEKWSGQERSYTEVEFSTKGYFRIGFYQEGIKQTYFAQCGDIGALYCFFKSPTSFAEVRTKVENGLSILQGK
jgi:hypothetical protein